MPATTLDGADRLIALAKNVGWPTPFDECGSPLVNVTKIGEKYAVRVRVAGKHYKQRYFGALENPNYAARLADLMTHAFSRCDDARFNYSRNQAIEDMKQSDLADLVERWRLLFVREKVIEDGVTGTMGPSCCCVREPGEPGPAGIPDNIVTLDPSEMDKLRIQMRDLWAVVDSLVNQVAELQQRPQVISTIPDPPQPPMTVTALGTTFTGPPVAPSLFKKP